MTDRKLALEQITRWGKFPAWWLHHPDMDADRIAVMAALATYADEDGFCEPSQATLAKRLCRSRPWANRVVADLAAIGLLRKQSRSRTNGGTTSCRYQLAQKPEQAVEFASEHRGEDAVPAVTVEGRRQDRGCHPGDTSHADLEHNQNPRPAARGGTDANSSVERGPAEPAPQADLARSAPSEPPRDWLPSEQAVAEALRLCPDADLDEHTARFVSRCRSKGYRYLSLDDAWIDWLLGDRREQRLSASKSRDGAAGRPGRARQARPSEHRLDRFEAWAAAATTPRCGTEAN